MSNVDGAPTALAMRALQHSNIAMTRVGERFALRHVMLARALGLASLLFVGCIDDRDVRLPDDVEQERAESFEIPLISPAPLDLLIVVDNSAAMAQFEETVAANLPEFGTLFERNLGWWDRHIGVTTADVGCPGRTAWRPAQLTNGSFFIDWRHLDDTRTKNFEGTLDQHLPQAMAAGHDGCGAHRPLDAIIAALDPAAHFRRTDADLMILVIGASDDQSEATVQEALFAISSTCVPSSNARMRTIAIAPPEATRLEAFATQSNDGALVPIATPKLVEATGWAFAGVGTWGGVHCFESENLDMDLATDGMQANCSVSDRVRDRETNTTTYDRPLPACNGSNRPCWRLEKRPNGECWSSGYGIEIDRIDFPPTGTILTGQCEIAETP